jgi:hypothetical protein
MRNPIDKISRRFFKQREQTPTPGPMPQPKALRWGREERPSSYNPKFKFGRSQLQIEDSRRRRQRNKARRISQLAVRRRNKHGRAGVRR